MSSARTHRFSAFAWLEAQHAHGVTTDMYDVPYTSLPSQDDIHQQHMGLQPSSATTTNKLAFTTKTVLTTSPGPLSPINPIQYPARASSSDNWQHTVEATEPRVGPLGTVRTTQYWHRQCKSPATAHVCKPHSDTTTLSYACTT